jgi:hypothetical protein
LVRIYTGFIVTPREQTVEVFPKFFVKKQIEERVDTAMGDTNDLCDLHTSVQFVAALTVLKGQAFLESGEAKDNTVGGPHQKEDDHYCKNNLEELELLLPETSWFSDLDIAK